MKRNRSLSVMRSYLLPAFAAIVLTLGSVGTVGCSTTSDGESSAAVDGVASGEEAQNGNGLTNPESGEPVAGDNLGNNINGVSNDTAGAGGEVSPENNPIGNELNNAIGGDPNTAGAQGSELGGAEPGSEGGDGAPGNLASGDSPGGEVPTDAPPVDAAAADPFAASGAAPLPAVGNAPSDVPPAGEAQNPVADDPSAPNETTTKPAAEATEPTNTAVSGPSSLPEMGAKLAYYVMRGDTLGGIAQKIYGSRARWKGLQTENGLLDANKIYPGDVIYYTLNEASKAFADKYEKGSRNSYTVVKGDTLSGIAAKFYGSQGAWRILWKENPQVTNPDRIRIGMVLTYRTENKVALKDDEDVELEVVGDGSDTGADADMADVLTASAE